jgi:hypothetical protein
MPLTPEFSAEYEAHAHRIQTGCMQLIALGKQGDSNSGSPKHLLTGNMLRATDLKATVDLLIAKGIITEDEYLDQIMKATKEEADRLERQISQMVGYKITLI